MEVWKLWPYCNGLWAVIMSSSAEMWVQNVWLFSPLATSAMNWEVDASGYFPPKCNNEAPWPELVLGPSGNRPEGYVIGRLQEGRDTAGPSRSVSKLYGSRWHDILPGPKHCILGALRQGTETPLITLADTNPVWTTLEKIWRLKNPSIHMALLCTGYIVYKGIWKTINTIANCNFVIMDDTKLCRSW